MDTSTASSTTSTLQDLSVQASQKAQALGQNFLAVYFSHLGFLEFLSIIFTIAVVVAIVYFVRETGWARYRSARFRALVLKSNISREQARKSWANIQQHFFRGGESDLKVSILEADKLLNEAMRDAGIMGIQLGDRLKKANAQDIPNLNDIWQAHKLRNQIAHESNFKLKRDLAERALNIYEVALTNLGIFEEEKTTER
jgi:hypothetical protein